MAPSLRHHDDDEEEQTPFIRGSVIVAPEQPHQPHQREQRKRGAAMIAVLAITLGALLGVFASSPLPQPNPPQIPPECVTALGGGVMGPGGSIRMTAGRNDSGPSSPSSGGGCRSALAAYAAFPNGPYYRDVGAAVEAAYAALGIVDNDDEDGGSTLRPTATTPRGVVIFDIDETALSNAPLSSEAAAEASSSLLFSANPQLFTSDGARRVNRADSPALEPTLRLYRALQRQGLAAAFVTGRGEASRQETEQNLRSAGYGGQCGEGGKDSDSTSSSYCYLSLTLRAPGDARPASVYKPEARRAVAKATGLPVAASVGDQWSDLSGEERQAGSSSPYVAIKLPNPFYYIL
jgi:hypothetical protein